jgi:hypothetical protein
VENFEPLTKAFLAAFWGKFFLELLNSIRPAKGDATGLFSEIPKAYGGEVAPQSQAEAGASILVAYRPERGLSRVKVKGSPLTAGRLILGFPRKLF